LIEAKLGSLVYIRLKSIEYLDAARKLLDMIEEYYSKDENDFGGDSYD